MSRNTAASVKEVRGRGRRARSQTQTHTGHTETAWPCAAKLTLGESFSMWPACTEATKKEEKKIAVCYLQEEAAFVDRAPQRKALFCGFGVGGCRAGDLLPGGLVLVRYKTKSVEGRYS